MATEQVFDEESVRSALARLAAALQDDDPLAWVEEYTDDAVFDGGGAVAVRGRDELLAMAGGMRPLTDVEIEPLRVEGSGDLAVVWFRGSWRHRGAAHAAHGHVDATRGDDRVAVRGILALRREHDGAWKVALEHLS